MECQWQRYDIYHTIFVSNTDALNNYEHRMLTIEHQLIHCSLLSENYDHNR